MNKQKRDLLRGSVPAFVREGTITISHEGLDSLLDLCDRYEAALKEIVDIADSRGCPGSNSCGERAQSALENVSSVEPSDG